MIREDWGRLGVGGGYNWGGQLENAKIKVENAKWWNPDVVGMGVLTVGWFSIITRQIMVCIGSCQKIVQFELFIEVGIMRFGFLGLVAFWVISVMGGRGFGVERPFVLWDKADIDRIRERIETEDWAKAAYEKLLSEADGNERQFAGLLRYALS
ncbi:MAG: hypothetical protein JRJ38_20105, partial [Deltaproteobacteria bacterium]|nr:hypothetical protein [Deltaproteobacteria bacterium]